MNQPRDRTIPHWVIYALGGGWGHLNRALALGRVAAQKYRVTILTNSPNMAFVDLKSQPASPAISAIRPPNPPMLGGIHSRSPAPPKFGGLGGLNENLNLCLAAIAPDLSREATCDRVRQFLLNTTYDCLIVDTFARGLGGELVEVLPQLKVPRILVHRDLNPEYVQAKDLRPFVAQQFQQVLIPGEGDDLSFAQLPHVHHTDPWLIRNADELPSVEKARSLLRIPIPTSPTVIVCASPTVSSALRGRETKGLDQEASLFGELTVQLQAALPEVAVRCLAPTCPPHCPPELWVTHWPGIDCLQIADVVVGGAGYNTTYECAALQIPLVSFAFQRLYDRQLRRAERCNYLVQDISEAIATVKMLLQQSLRHRSHRPPIYKNGAVEAVKVIEQAIAATSD